MSDNGNKQKITVETLLRIKKSERPGDDFWDNFERDFDRRRLNELVNRPSWTDMLLKPAIRAFALGVPALAMIALALLWTPAEEKSVSPLVINDEPANIENPEPSIDLTSVKLNKNQLEDQDFVVRGATSNQFVVDAIHEQNGSAMQFRKVLYSPAIHLSVPSGSFYVRDNMSSTSYEVTSADLKLGRNF